MFYKVELLRLDTFDCKRKDIIDGRIIEILNTQHYSDSKEDYYVFTCLVEYKGNH